MYLRMRLCSRRTCFFFNFIEVGTRLYIAPEVQSRKRGPRNHSKADMYSLGVRVSNLFLSVLLLMRAHATLQIVFFEMNYAFTTGFERIAVLEYMRTPGIRFPSGWDAHRTRQRESKFLVSKTPHPFLLKLTICIRSHHPAFTAY